MPCLPQLPPEISSTIAEAVVYGDIENYALTCKAVYLKSLPTLQAHRARKKYADTTVVSFAQPRQYRNGERVTCLKRCWRYHPFWLLQAILRDPPVADHVHTLNIVDQSIEEMPAPGPCIAEPDPSVFTSEPLNKDATFEIICKSLESFIDTYKCQIQQMVVNANDWILEPNTAIVDTWYDLLFGVATDAILVLLLLQLPNLKTLKMRSWLGPIELQVLCRVIQRTRSPGSTAGQAFSRLKEVELECLDESGNIGPLMLLHHFCTLPTVRTIKGIRLCSSQRPNLERDYSSHITSIHLHECDVRIINELRSFGRPTCLKSFYFTTKHWYRYPWRAIGVQEWLLINCTQSLEELTFYRPYSPVSEPDMADDFLGSLRQFKHLRHVKVLVDSFIPHDNDDANGLMKIPQFLTRMLPSSLENLVLVGKSRLGFASEMVHQIYELKKNYLSNLKQVVFEEDPEVDGEIISRSASVGLDMTFGVSDGDYETE